MFCIKNTDAEIQDWLGSTAEDDISALKMVKTSGAIVDGIPSNYSISAATASSGNSDLLSNGEVLSTEKIIKFE